MIHLSFLTHLAEKINVDKFYPKLIEIELIDATGFLHFRHFCW